MSDALSALFPKTSENSLRVLAASRIIEEIKSCLPLPMGLPLLASWFEGDGKFWLESAGLGYLVRVPSHELAALCFENGPGELVNKRCIKCRELVRIDDNGRVRCRQNHWQAAGFQEEYALGTVRNSSRAPFSGYCEDWREKDES